MLTVPVRFAIELNFKTVFYVVFYYFLLHSWFIFLEWMLCKERNSTHETETQIRLLQKKNR